MCLEIQVLVSLALASSVGHHPLRVHSLILKVVSSTTLPAVHKSPLKSRKEWRKSVCTSSAKPPWGDKKTVPSFCTTAVKCGRP